MADSLAPTKWVCKYHIVFTPKYRRKIIYNPYKESVVQILKDLGKWTALIGTNDERSLRNSSSHDFNRNRDKTGRISPVSTRGS